MGRLWVFIGWEVFIIDILSLFLLKELKSSHEDGNSLVLINNRCVKLDYPGLSCAKFSLKKVNSCLLGGDWNRSFVLPLGVLLDCWLARCEWMSSNIQM